ncbi:hypothetical protein WBG78_03530 [Chryseolinea sp. T2]|uniref:hypothetical protein n=1 Tax=Chryseolinea sp. T2 TaxID=3129255 RepID=UPI0030784086
MKNLPDEELFERIKVRLQNFEEAPDEDVWAGIGSAISKPTSSTQTRNRYALILVLMLLSVGRGYLFQTSDPDATITSSSSSAQASLNADTNTPTSNNDIASDIDNKIKDQSPAQNENMTELKDMNLTSTSQLREAKSAGVIKETAGHTMPIVLPDASPGTNSGLHMDSVNHSIVYLDSSLLIDSIKIDDVSVKRDSITQEEIIVSAKPRKHESRWRIYGMATPSLTFQHVNPSTSDDATFDKLNSPGVLSSERLSFSFEAGAQFLVARRLNVFAGLSYYQQSAELSLDQIISGSSNIASNGGLEYEVQPNTITTTIDYHMQNIGLIAGASYVISVGKLVHQLGGGMQYEYGLINRSTETDSRSTKNFVNFRIFYRAEYGLNERMSVFVQPVFSRSLLNDEVMNGALNVKQSRAGIGFGVLYRFR